MGSNVTVLPIAASTPAGSEDLGGSARRKPPPPEVPAPTRLVIEEGPSPGAFIYKALDPVTGEVIRQLPREELLRLMGDQRTPAGSVIDTRA
ncbi:MAG: hypothetical protein ACK4Z5_06495 [Brevundimonas sp.]